MTSQKITKSEKITEAEEKEFNAFMRMVLAEGETSQEKSEREVGSTERFIKFPRMTKS